LHLNIKIVHPHIKLSNLFNIFKIKSNDYFEIICNIWDKNNERKED